MNWIAWLLWALGAVVWEDGSFILGDRGGAYIGGCLPIGWGCEDG